MIFVHTAHQIIFFKRAPVQVHSNEHRLSTRLKALLDRVLASVSNGFNSVTCPTLKHDEPLPWPSMLFEERNHAVTLWVIELHGADIATLVLEEEDIRPSWPHTC